jgi:glyoxylase-like metal-dependent hydrolase (beta-lactamase superfamily II)
VSGPPGRFERFGANLWRWTTPHPLWTPKETNHTGRWPRDVGSVVSVRDGTATIVDPQAGDDDGELWAFLDAQTAGAERVVVALTASWHLRSSVAVLDRLPVTLVLPAHGPPAPEGPTVVRDALARPPWRLFGSG